MRRPFGVVAVLCILLSAGVTAAAVINVPGDYALIHDAVQAAQPGDVVQVARQHQMHPVPYITPGRGLTERMSAIIASQAVIDLFLDEESQPLALLGEAIGKPIRLQVENMYLHSQYDIVLS